VVAVSLKNIIMKLVTKEPYVPFGPFLSLGAVVTLFVHAELLWVLLVWYPGLLR
jgi:prepilin signal peptidase PulO-like enzyme (type II secretory pathway)